MWFKKYLLPGLIFQSVTIGGGYGTGRELVEFFLSQGPKSGYLGMITAMSVFSLVMAISFELARMGKNYNYRNFLGGLLGKGWIGYEVLYIALVILTISVVGSAANKLLNAMFGISEIVGSILIMILMAVIAFFGGKVIEKVLSMWSFALYTVYIILFFSIWYLYENQITSALAIQEEESQWFINGLRYAGYNIAVVPALLYSTRYIETKKEALLSGLLAGLVAIVPAFLFYTAMLSHYSEVQDQSFPSNYILEKLNSPIFQFIFQIILLGTFMETGIGLIHGLNERVAGVYREQGKKMPQQFRFIIAFVLLIIAIFFANAIGLVGLIAEGYGTITWGFWLIFVLPVLTYGVWKIVKAEG